MTRIMAIPSHVVTFFDCGPKLRAPKCRPAKFGVAVIVAPLPGAIESLSTTVSVIVPGVDQS
jgi:hypothetical protein